MAAACRRVVAGRTALGAALLIGLGTGNWTVSADGAWTHGLTLLMLSLGLVAFSRERPAWAGLAMAGAIFSRPQTVVAPAVMGLWTGIRQRRFRVVAVVAATSALGVVGLLAWYVGILGEWLPRSRYVTSVATGAASVGGTGGLLGIWRWLGSVGLWLVSPTRGIFVFSPFLLLLVPSLRQAWRCAPDWVRSSAAAALVYVVVQSRGNVWHGGGNYFGYRLQLEALTLAWPLLAIGYERWVLATERRRTTFAVLAMASVVVFAIGNLMLRPNSLAGFPAGEGSAALRVPSEAPGHVAS